MTIADIRRRLEEIRQVVAGAIPVPARDASAHELEDALYRDLLWAIATGEIGGLSPDSEAEPEDVQRLAAEAIRSQEIAFSRWYE